MANVKPWAKTALGAPVTPASVRIFCGVHNTKSVTRAIWDKKMDIVEDLFDGGTDEDDEDKALSIILNAESYGEIAFMANRLGWDALDDDLDEGDLTKIAGRISALRNRREHLADKVIRGLALNPDTLGGNNDAITKRVQGLGDFGRHKLADALIDGRAPLLASVAAFALRGLPTHALELRAAIDILAGMTPDRAAELRALSWDVLYDDRIGAQLAGARYRLLLQTLPDMADPTLPAARRKALFDSLNRRENDLLAMQQYIDVMGTLEQRADVGRFMDARRVFMDNFSTNPPTPSLIQQLAAFFDAIADEIAELRAAVLQTAQQIIDGLTLGHLTDAESDDKARQVVSVLGGSGRLANLPFIRKADLIFRMEEGNCDDDDEAAILRVLETSKDRSVAEFTQLVNAQGWESLDFSFDGQEYSKLESLLSHYPT